jgi:hypothetical protein
LTRISREIDEAASYELPDLLQTFSVAAEGQHADDLTEDRNDRVMVLALPLSMIIAPVPMMPVARRSLPRLT